MTDPKELIAWLRTLHGHVAVDDGGLTLVEVNAEGQTTAAYYEVGGLPADEE